MDFKNLIGSKLLLKHWANNEESECILIDAWEPEYGENFIMLLNLSDCTIYSYWESDWDLIQVIEDETPKDINKLIVKYRTLRYNVNLKQDKMSDILDEIIILSKQSCEED